MSETITGNVVSTKKDSTGFKINDRWYSVYKDDETLKGVVSGLYQTQATVEFVTKTKGDRTFYNVRSINGVGGKGGGSSSAGTNTAYTPNTTQKRGDYRKLNAWKAIERAVGSGQIKVTTPTEACALALEFEIAWGAVEASEKTETDGNADAETKLIEAINEMGATTIDSTTQAWGTYREAFIANKNTDAWHELLSDTLAGKFVIVNTMTGGIEFVTAPQV